MVTAPADGGRHIEHLLGEFRDLLLKRSTQILQAGGSPGGVASCGQLGRDRQRHLAQHDKARAQAELDTAQERLETARKALSDEYGISTADEAKELQARLQAELEAAQEDIEKVLSEAGA